MTAADGGLSTAVSWAGGQVAVRCSGEIDVETGPELRKALKAALAEGPERITVDLAGVTFCDCTGLGLLVGVRRRAQAAGVEFEVTGVTSPTVAKLIRIFGLAELLGVKWPAGG